MLGTYSTSLVCGWDHRCCPRPLRSELWSQWGSFLQSGFEAPHWFYWSLAQKSCRSRPDDTQPAGEGGQTCSLWKTASQKGRRVCEMCFLSCLLFTAGLLNSKCLGRLLVWPNTKWRGFYKQDLWRLRHTSVETLVSVAFQSKRNAIKCRIGRKELNFSSILTALLLSAGTDLLILEGQTGPAHNNSRVARSIFPRQRETHLFGMTVAEGLIVPPAPVLLLSHWQTHLVSCHLGLILHRLDMFPVQKDLRVG